jgi:glucose-1-phosphate cytidylyltransferase
MKISTAIILAGGKGTRFAEQTQTLPKPLIPVGGRPIIFHVINHFVDFGFKKIIIATGYKADVVVDVFQEELKSKRRDDFIFHNESCATLKSEDNLNSVEIILCNTGENTGTAQRIKKCKRHLEEGEDFFITYGDGLSDVNLSKVETVLFSTDSHMALTAVPFQERFGILKTTDLGLVTFFGEKSLSRNEFINGGFIACRYEVLDYIKETDTDFSHNTMPRIQDANKMAAHVHEGFWQCMDSQRDYEKLNRLYEERPELFSGGR